MWWIVSWNTTHTSPIHGPLATRRGRRSRWAIVRTVTVSALIVARNTIASGGMSPDTLTHGRIKLICKSRVNAGDEKQALLDVLKGTYLCTRRALIFRNLMSIQAVIVPIAVKLWKPSGKTIRAARATSLHWGRGRNRRRRSICTRTSNLIFPDAMHPIVWIQSTSWTVKWVHGFTTNTIVVSYAKGNSLLEKEEADTVTT
jgi:hypothetical protein